jgi:hypothetical protein
MLDQFFGAAVQQADMRIGALDNLAVHLQHRRSTPCAAGCCGPKFIVYGLIWVSCPISRFVFRKSHLMAFFSFRGAGIHPCARLHGFFIARKLDVCHPSHGLT